MLQFSKTRLFRVLAVVVALTALYALAGFVLAPKLLRAAILKDVPARLGVTPAVGEIRLNPFLLQVTVENFSLTATGGERLLGFSRLFVDFDLSSLWHRAYSFGTIDLAAPYVSATVAPDGTLNLMELKPKTTTPQTPPAANDGPLPAIRIGSFKISQGFLSYQDRSQAEVFDARLEPVNFELREFTTGADGGQFTFTATTPLGERIDWRGHLSVQPIESDGEFRVDGLRVHTLWEYLEDKLNFAVNSGTVELAATYRFSAGNDMAGGRPANLQVELSKLLLRDLAVRPKGAELDWLTVPELSVTGGAVDVAQRRAHVDRVAITGLKLLTWLEPDGSLNLMKLVPAPTPAASGGAQATGAAQAAGAPQAAGGTQAVGAASQAPAPPWQFDLRQFELHAASLSAEDRSMQPAAKVVLAPLSLQVNGVSQDLSKQLSLTLDTGINAAGSLAIKGGLTPQPVAADLDLTLAGVELAALQPYIARHSSMTLLGGRLGGEAKLHYDARQQPPALRLAGNVEVAKLHTVDNALHDDFINWDRLSILGLNYSQNPNRLEIDKIAAQQPYARVIIEADESLNVKRILTLPGAAPQASAAAHGTRTAAASRSGRAAGGHGGEATGGQGGEALPMSIKTVLIEGGQANFTDLSVSPNFSTAIQGLGGSITGLSSKPSARSKVDLHGSVDAYAPVSIVGEFNVLGPKLYTDIGMSFRNIELSVFNPYSGKFAGYNISKGKLTTDLHYLVNGRRLDAQHHVVVEQLEFGDKTASKDAVSLPVKLAVALLKDRNGVIDLSLPVGGSLDDPTFRLGPLIWKVFVNILEKAVTAPFALLGALFGAGPDLQFIGFKPGTSSLDPAAADKVRTVAKALIERPQLKLEVPIGVVPDIDRPALIAARFSAELGAVQATQRYPKNAAPAGEARPYEQLDPATQLELLSRLYAKDFGTQPKYPEAVSGLKSKPEATAAKIGYLEQAVREHLQIGAGELETLGQQRALALQQLLLADTQVAPERIFLVANDRAKPKDGLVELELSLQ